MPARKPAYIASPPIVGVGTAWTVRSFGLVDRPHAHHQAPHERRDQERRPRAREEDQQVGAHAGLSVRFRPPCGNRAAAGRSGPLRVQREALHQVAHLGRAFSLTPASSAFFRPRPGCYAISRISGSSMPRVDGPGRAHADARRGRGRVRVVGDLVLVEGDPHLVGQRPRRSCRRRRAAAVSARIRCESVPPDTMRSPSSVQPGGQGPRITDGSIRVVRNSGVEASFRATAFAAMQCSSGPPCIIGNTALSMALACSSLHTIMAPRGPRSALCVVKVTTSA